MKVAIFDVKHFEVVENSLRFFDDGKNEIYLFVSEAIYQQFVYLHSDTTQRHHWVVHNRPGEEKSYLDSVREAIISNGIELFWINSITNNFFKCALVVKAISRHGCRSVLTLHNINHFLAPRLPTSARSAKAWIGRKLLASQVQGFNVLAPTLETYLRDNCGYQKPVFVVPGVAIDDALLNAPATSERIVFVIPGSIEEKRRDYNLVLDVFGDLLPVNPHVQLVLLGAPVGEYGASIINRCRDIQTRKDDVIFFESFVDARQFHAHMLNADILIAPINVDTSFAGDREEYGISKSSGAIGDATRYGLPILVPTDLPVPTGMNDMCCKYDSREDFRKSIHDLTDNSIERQQLINNARQIAHNFSAQSVRKENDAKFKLLFE